MTSYRKQRYRSIFLSDFHIGSPACDAPALLDFLKSTECDHLFLMGDIIDGWKLEKRWHWTEEYNCILDELAHKASQGTKITYTPGNHDEKIRPISSLVKKLGIQVKPKAVHTFADGRQFLVLHGDEFDHALFYEALSRWRKKLKSTLKQLARVLQSRNLQWNTGSLPHFSLSQTLKKHNKIAPILLNNFEQAAIKTAKKYEVDGIVCGHTHIPTIKAIDDTLYANAGSWTTQKHTALVETIEGKMEVLDWPSSQTVPALPHILNAHKGNIKIVDDAKHFRPLTEAIVRKAHQIWAPSNTTNKPAKAKIPFIPSLTAFHSLSLTGQTRTVYH